MEYGNTICLSLHLNHVTRGHQFKLFKKHRACYTNLKIENWLKTSLLKILVIASLVFLKVKFSKNDHNPVPRKFSLFIFSVTWRGEINGMCGPFSVQTGPMECAYYHYYLWYCLIKYPGPFTPPPPIVKKKQMKHYSWSTVSCLFDEYR